MERATVFVVLIAFVALVTGVAEVEPSRASSRRRRPCAN
jgi:hypothetical protein